MSGDRSVLENGINCEGGIDRKKYFEQLQNLGFRDVTNSDLPDEKYGVWKIMKLGTKEKYARF